MESVDESDFHFGGVELQKLEFSKRLNKDQANTDGEFDLELVFETEVKEVPSDDVPPEVPGEYAFLVYLEITFDWEPAQGPFDLCLSLAGSFSADAGLSEVLRRTPFEGCVAHFLQAA